MALPQLRQDPQEIAPAHLTRLVRNLADGARTTVHVATYARAAVRPRVELLPSPLALEGWCRQRRIEEALVGGFYLREPQTSIDPLLHGKPLGELRSGGEPRDSVPFEAPWGARRACIHVAAGAEVRIARRDELGADLDGDLLQAGPMLVRAGAAVAADEEGFSAGSGQFDSDITVGRHPRAAIGLDGERLIAVACEGRIPSEAGLTLAELAATLVELGAESAMNLDGGGSTSLICAGRLRNVPRDADGTELPGGRPIATALVFAPR